MSPDFFGSLTTCFASYHHFVSNHPHLPTTSPLFWGPWRCGLWLCSNKSRYNRSFAVPNVRGEGSAADKIRFFGMGISPGNSQIHVSLWKMIYVYRSICENYFNCGRTWVSGYPNTDPSRSYFSCFISWCLEFVPTMIAQHHTNSIPFRCFSRMLAISQCQRLIAKPKVMDGYWGVRRFMDDEHPILL